MKSMDSVLEEKIEPDQDNANIYLCGLTVYDDAHLGYARSSAYFDLLRKILLSLGYRVQFVRNYIDIDDKILKKMSENGKNLDELAEFYMANHERDMKALNVLEPDSKPRVTHYVESMLDFIHKLSRNGFAYTLEDGVYFDISKDEDYLSLSYRNIEENVSGLSNEVEKRNESDFALWKFDENLYDSELGKERPGRHTECVAMIDSIFGDTLGIYADGVDLLFPHHENEAAQCCYACKRTLAKIWLYNGFVKINGEKMSKGLNNSFFLRDALKDSTGETLRFYLLSFHYRAHFNHSLDDLENIKKRLDKSYRLKKRLAIGEILDFGILNDTKTHSNIAKQILEILSDDLNISKALALLDEFITNTNLELDQQSKNKELKQKIKEALNELAKIFGFDFMDENLRFRWGVAKESKEKIQDRILQRNEAKKNKDFAKADQIREDLLRFGIALQDTP